MISAGNLIKYVEVLLSYTGEHMRVNGVSLQQRLAFHGPKVEPSRPVRDDI